MILATELIVSVLALTVSSLLWKLAAHRLRFRDLVCSRWCFLLIRRESLLTKTITCPLY